MKTKITEEIKEIFTQSINWAKLELEYIKLTVAEKLIVLVSMLLLVTLVVLMFIPVMLMFMFALAQVFINMMPVALAYVTVAGIFIVLLLLLFLLRKPLIFNPMAKFISKLVIEHKSNEKKNG